MTGTGESEYQPITLRGVRPYLIVEDADAAITFYRGAFNAVEVERQATPSGGIGHAKLRIGDSIVEMGEHPDVSGRAPMRLPSVGLRLYVTDVDETFARAIAAGASGDPPSDRPEQGTRAGTVYDPFGLTWWIATPTP